VRLLRHDAKARPKQLICKIEPFPEWESEFPRRGSHFASYAEVKGSLASVKAADELHFLTGQPLSICQKLLSGHRVENRDMIIALFQTHLVIDVIWTLVDAEDYAWLSEHIWNVSYGSRTPWQKYAKRNEGPDRATLRMHREILIEADPRSERFIASHHGDHINGQTLDNRRANLRWATQKQNAANRFARDAIPSQANVVDSPAPCDGEPAGMEATASRVADGRTSDEGAAVAATAAPDQLPAAPIELPEFEALKMISDFCHPKRAELLPRIAPAYAERGLAIQQSATGEWMLREAGWARLRELEAEPRARAPDEPHALDIPAILRCEPKKPKAKIEPQLEMDLARIDREPPEVVDGKLQTRLPLTDDELAMQAALLAIDAGERVETEMMRHLIGAGFARATTTRVVVTGDGREFLAQLVGPAPSLPTEVHA
jgi:hypothetical protein